MPIHDFRCTACNHVHAELVKWNVTTHKCRKCENESKRVFLQLAKPNYLEMGAQRNVSPEFQDRFDKMHREQAAKETAFEKEHGEGQYGNRGSGG